MRCQIYPVNEIFSAASERYLDYETGGTNIVFMIRQAKKLTKKIRLSERTELAEKRLPEKKTNRSFAFFSDGQILASGSDGKFTRPKVDPVSF